MQLLPRGFKAGHVIKDFKSTGEVCQAPGRLRKPGIRNNGRKENRKWPAEVGWPNSTQQKKAVEVERDLSSQVSHAKSYQRGNIICTQRQEKLWKRNWREYHSCQANIRNGIYVHRASD